MPQDYPIYKFDEIDSTNLEAKRMISSGFTGNAVIMANNQTMGYGRNDKIWVSPPGNLYFTILLKKRLFIDIAGYLSYLAACVLGDSLLSFNQSLHSVLLYKWPNDILLEHKKLAGILLESKITNQQLDWLIIGVGINLQHFPAQVENPATSLKDFLAGKDDLEISPLQLLDKFLCEFTKQFEQLERDGFAKVREKWLQYAKGIGERIEVSIKNQKISGQFEGIDNFGNLILRDKAGQIKLISSGEVYFGA